MDPQISQILPIRDWERLYTNAILETDRSKLTARIEAARAAIARRLQDHGGTATERLEIESARHGLDMLRKRVAMPW
jgi:hypothetical protein